MVQCVDRLPVIVHAGVHRTYESDIIGDRTQMGDKLAEFHPALAVAFPFPRPRPNFRGRFGRVVVLEIACVFFAVSLFDFDLTVEKIDMRWSSLHKHRDHGFGLRGLMRKLGL